MKTNIDIRAGYKLLKQKGKLDFIYKLKNEILNKNLNDCKPLFDLDEKLTRKVLQQFFLQRILNLKFNESVLASLNNNQKLKFGLPKTFLYWLSKEKNFKSLSIYNKFLWFKTVLFWYLAGIYFIFLYFIRLIKLRNKKSSNKNFIYFSGLDGKNFPKNFENSKTIINWFLNRKQNYNYQYIFHDYIKSSNLISKQIFIHSSLFPFNFKSDYKLIFKYILNTFSTSIYSLIQLLKGNPFPSLLLKEYPLLYLSRQLKAESHAKAYFFHNSSPMYKPLWATVSENLGSDVIMYFYSTNNRVLEIDNKSHLYSGHREFMSWNKYFVWNQNQKDYIKIFSPKSKIEITGPIWFQTKNISIKNLSQKRRIISVFDVQPYTSEFFIKLALPTEYYISSIVNKFHLDIYNLFKKDQSFQIVLKRKRTNNLVDKEYLKCIRNIYKNENFIQLDPDIDAYSLIEKSFAAINLPATSTALIADYLGVKSIYYDPSGLISVKEKSLGNIPFVSKKSNLRKWKDSID